VRSDQIPASLHGYPLDWSECEAPDVIAGFLRLARCRPLGIYASCWFSREVAEAPWVQQSSIDAEVAEVLEDVYADMVLAGGACA